MKIIIILLFALLIEKGKLEETQSNSKALFEFHPTPKQSKLINEAIEYWTDKDMKQKLMTEIPRQFFSGRGTPQNILKVLLNDTEKDDSKKESNYIKYAIGEKTIDYLIHMQRSLGQVNGYPELSDYINNIKYTNIGLINRPLTSAETFLVVNNYNDSTTVDRKFIFVESCRYLFTEYPVTIWNSTKDDDRNDIRASLVDTSNNPDIAGLDIFMKTIVKYWGRKLNLNLTPNNNNNDTENPEIKKILTTYALRLLDEDSGMLKYFLNESHLSSDKKDQFILDHLLKYDLTSYFSNSVDHWIYLMKKLTDTRRATYLDKNKNSLLDLMFDSWPWRYLYLDIVNSTNKNSDQNLKKMLGEIFGKIIEEYEIKKNTEYLSFWMVDKFLDKYSNFFENKDIIQLYWSTSSADFISKVKLLIPLMKHFKHKKIQPISTENPITKELTKLSFMFDLYDEYDLLHDIANEVLQEDEDKVAIMKEIDLDNICLYFLINNINDKIKIENVIKWAFNWVEKSINRYKQSMKLTKIVKKIISSEKGEYSTNDILKSLFEWKGYSHTQKTELEKCLTKHSDEEKIKKWNKFKVCLLKSLG
ncbi:hypothetical protein HCN44_003536 [Aphidius gifuensis]|uniref:Venom protein n=1 Tax=Aphidius gifuensis TaxID=684658 RepID=A0A834XIG2_APHGI|nr:hypothetical protein HCN44_003536 [Aphidius gifuensis]